jgi:hypothetical protein
VNNRGVKQTHCILLKNTALIEAAGCLVIVKMLVENNADLGLEGE